MLKLKVAILLGLYLTGVVLVALTNEAMPGSEQGSTAGFALLLFGGLFFIAELYILMKKSWKRFS